MCLQSIILEKVEEAIEIQMEKRKGTISGGDEAMRNLEQKMTMEVTFEFFKKNCFDAWKFKNQVLACNEFIIVESFKRKAENFGKLNRDINERSLEVVMKELEQLKKEAEKNPDEDLEKVFWPLLNTMMIIVFISIGNKRASSYSEKINNVFNVFLMFFFR